MIINNNETSDVSRLNLDKTQARPPPPAPPRPNPPAPTPRQGSDSISLSNSPNLVQQALNSSSAARSARVQELKALVAEQSIPARRPGSQPRVDQRTSHGSLAAARLRASGMQTASEYGDARECLQAARASMRQVKRLLSQPSAEAADESAALLAGRRSSARLRGRHSAAERRQTGYRDSRPASKSCKAKWPCSPAFSPGRTRCFPAWLDAVRSRRGGYTERGQAAPLVLVRKLSVEG